MAPIDTLADLYDAIVADGIARLDRHWEAALAGQEVAVHQSRVALRRLRSHMAMLRPWAEASWARPLVKDLAALAAPLGPVRDLDVLAGRLILDGNEKLDGGGEPLEARRARQRQRALADAQRALDNPEASSQLARVRQHLATPALDGTVAIATVSTIVLDDAWARASSTVDNLKKRPRDAELHRVRIKVKRLRYGAAALASSPEDHRRRLAKKAAAVQDVLGGLNDASFAEAWLRDASAGSTRLVAFAAGRLVERELGRAASARSDWRPRWEALALEAARVVGQKGATS
ncbi:MAG: hypothetical protein QOG03_1522 [Actinomycetota bacterium]|nr:hypothetical protein [Actinomycetota bacterium]